MMSKIDVSHSESESGQSIVLVALAMVTLLAFVGLALDGGMAYAERRQMQTAADAAALAGARTVTLGMNQSVIHSSIAEYSNTRNKATGFRAKYYPGLQPIDSSAGIPPVGCTGVCVTSAITYPSLFVGIIGIGQLSLQADSCAAVHDCAGGYTVWADASDPTIGCPVLEWPGDHDTATGNVHSNRDVFVPSSGNKMVNGTLEYVTTLGPQPIIYNPPSPHNPVQTNVVPNPYYFDVKDYQPGGAAATWATGQGKYTYVNGDLDDQNAPYYNSMDGLYYVTGNVHVGADGTARKRTLTIVAEGQIDVQGNGGLDYSPYYGGLLFFSNEAPNATTLCSPDPNNAAINFGGGNNRSTWHGVSYAPRGRILVGSANFSTFDGTLDGYLVTLQTDYQTFTKNDQYCSVNQKLQAIHLR